MLLWIYLAVTIICHLIVWLTLLSLAHRLKAVATPNKNGDIAGSLRSLILIELMLFIPICNIICAITYVSRENQMFEEAIKNITK